MTQESPSAFLLTGSGIQHRVPRRTVSQQRALQGLATSQQLPVIGLSFIAAASVTGITRNSPGDLRLFVDPNVNPLAPFALYAAFPRSDYYGAFDAHALHWGTAPSLHEPPTFTTVPSAEVLRWGLIDNPSCSSQNPDRLAGTSG
jgi:hypothetical protein